MYSARSHFCRKFTLFGFCLNAFVFGGGQDMCFVSTATATPNGPKNPIPINIKILWSSIAVQRQMDFRSVVSTSTVPAGDPFGHPAALGACLHMKSFTEDMRT